MTSKAIKPATFRLVAQCLNKLNHRVTPRNRGRKKVKILGAISLILGFGFIDIRINSCEEFCLWLYQKTPPTGSCPFCRTIRIPALSHLFDHKRYETCAEWEFSSIWLGYCLLEAFNMSHQTTRWKAK